MQSLHNIVNGALEAWAWAHAIGGNGGILGKGKFAHAYLATRNTPPENNRQRTYWTPWRLGIAQIGWNKHQDRDSKITPLCGRISTTSTHPYIEGIQTGWRWRTLVYCPECTQIAQAQDITVRTPTQLNQQDPWYTQQFDHLFGIDPVTGL